LECDPAQIHASASTSRCAANSCRTHNALIDLHYWSTPNGHKITIFSKRPAWSTNFPVIIGKGDQFKPEFLAIANNGSREVDHAPKGGGKPISFRVRRYAALSGGEDRKVCPRPLGRYDAIQWTFGRWRLGPRCRQTTTSAIRRGKLLTPSTAMCQRDNRLYGVLNSASPTRIHRRRLLIADMRPILDRAYKKGQTDIDDFPHLKRGWTVGARPATMRAYARRKRSTRISPAAIRTEEERKLLFGQTRRW